MKTSRLEAFSDGVFAIVITLLVLDIRVPSVPPDRLGSALVDLLPSVAAYVMSFFVVALYWLVHHRMSHLIRRVNGTFVWLNMLWILFVSVIPFPTSLLGHYPLRVIPIVVYGSDLILTNITGLLVTLYVIRHPELTRTTTAQLTDARLFVPYAVTNGSYLVAIAFAWIAPIVSYLIFAGMLVRLAVRYAARHDPIFGPRSFEGEELDVADGTPAP